MQEKLYIFGGYAYNFPLSKQRTPKKPTVSLQASNPTPS
jgi:hypothetical protein